MIRNFYTWQSLQPSICPSTSQRNANSYNRNFVIEGTSWQHHPDDNLGIRVIAACFHPAAMASSCQKGDCNLQNVHGFMAIVVAASCSYSNCWSISGHSEGCASTTCQAACSSICDKPVLRSKHAPPLARRQAERASMSWTWSLCNLKSSSITSNRARHVSTLSTLR